jgi:hypothetical protein
MKMSKAFGFLFGAALLVSSAAVAGETNKSSVQLDNKVVVEGKTLDSGRYTVEWSGSGSDVQVTLLRGKQTVATNPQDAYSTTSEQDGSKTLTAIYPGGKRIALKIDHTQASQQSNASASK